MMTRGSIIACPDAQLERVFEAVRSDGGDEEVKGENRSPRQVSGSRHFLRAVPGRMSPGCGDQHRRVVKLPDELL